MNRKKCKKTIWLTCLLFLLQLAKIPFIVLFFNQFDTEKTIQIITSDFREMGCPWELETRKTRYIVFDLKRCQINAVI